jgi:hypothetical protein
MALIRTDYGLIYNTDGSLCATLLPEGGVAVTEGTTNLVTDQSFWNPRTGAIVTRELVTSGQWAGWYRVHVTRTGTGARGYIGNTQLISVAIDSTHTWSIDFYSETGKIIPRLDGAFGIEDLSRVNERRWALTWTNNRGSGGSQGIYFRHSDGAEIDVDEVFYYRRYQVEAKPYDTPYVEGTRPAGILSYPELVKQFNQREFTFAAWWKPYTELGIGSSFPDRFFHIDNGTNTAGNRIRLLRINESPGLRLEVPNIDGSGSRQYSFYPNSYPANAWHFIACVLDVPNMKARIHLNDEYQEFPLTEVPAMLDLQRFFLGCVESQGQLNGDLRGVLLRPYAVSPETVATWHSLDAPFYDPREQIDAGARPIYAPGVQIDSTGAWGVANGVKQAGFGTDGKWVAGGGAIIADAQGLRSSDDSFIIKSNGEAEFKGKITAPIIDTPQIVGGAISQRIVSSFQSSTGNMNSTDSWVSLPTSLSFSLSEPSEVLLTFSASTVLKAKDYRDYDILGVFRLVLNGVPIYASERYVGLSEYPVPGAGGTRGFRSSLNITSALHLEPGSYQIHPQFRLSYSRPIIDGSAVFCLDRELSALILKR